MVNTLLSIYYVLLPLYEDFASGLFQGWEFEIRISIVQLYCEKFSDLIDTQSNRDIKVDINSGQLSDMKVHKLISQCCPFLWKLF